MSGSVLRARYALYDGVVDDDDVHPRPQKTVERLCGRVDDGLILVERRVEHDRRTRELVELGNEAMVARVVARRDRLEAS